MTVRILTGDCRALLPSLEAESVDSCVTDPPYELGFMGKKWDSSGVAFDVVTWRETLRVLKPGAYLLAFGGTRTFHRMTCAIEDAGFEIHDCISWLYGSGFPKHKSKLKPAWEPVVVARRPGEFATPLQLDACRIAAGGGSTDEQGRWPANVVVDEEAAAMLDAQAGPRKSGANPTRRGSNKFASTYGDFAGQAECVRVRGAEVGEASRFFYCAKASRGERERGLEDDARRALNWSSGDQSPGTFQSAGTDKTSSNPHPTVKPIALMRWLCRLVTPLKGVVLDPFLGSGTTGVATEEEGFSLVACELDPANVELSDRRIRAVNPLFTEVTR